MSAAFLAGTVITVAMLASSAQAQTVSKAEFDELRRQMQAQAEEIEALRARLDTATAVSTKSNTDIASPNTPKPSFKASPEFREGDWKFKVRGRLMYDVGFIENPGDAIPTKSLGFGGRLSRARIGVEGSMPGGFNYELEFGVVDNAIAISDAYIAYHPANTPLFFRVGHFETFQSLEQITSSRHIMFMERGQMNEAFNNVRRFGGAIGFDKGPLLINFGVFNETINTNFDNDQYIVATRATVSPKWNDNQLHFGINYQYRTYKSNAQNFRYRVRNYARLSDVRLVDTGAFAMSNDELFGLEAAGIFGSFHVAAEWQQAKANALQRPPTGNGDSTGGVDVFLAGNPRFEAWYVEGGWWLTGETRGYKKGEWDRTRVDNGLDKGGIGAIGVNARFDSLDLQDSNLRSGGTGTQPSNGGKQDVIVASIIWQPIDYVRVTTQFNHNMITGGPFAATVVPDSTRPVWEREYTQNSFAMRFAYDF